MKKLSVLFLTILMAGAVSSGSAQSSNPNFTGDGGKGMRLAVLEPTGKGLSEDEQWMLSLVQGSITANFNKYSAMTIIDRQHVEKIIADIAQAMESGYYSDETMVKIGQMTNARYILAGVVTKTATAFAFELAVTDAESGERKASYPPRPVSALALENLSAVNEATADLLKQLGVSLTSAGLAELQKTPDMNNIQAENWLARGIVAERQGTKVTAQSYYFLAAALDPSLMEAATRSTTISANISSGNIGADVRNDIAWRDNWVTWLAEFENLFNETINNATPPYTLFYSTGIKQGEVNYQKRAVDLSISTNLRANSAWLNPVAQAANKLYAELNTGLNATGRKDTWGLGNWPRQGVTDTSPFASYRQKQYDLSIAFELVNEQNRVIGKQTLRLRPSFSLDRSNNDDRIVNTFTLNDFNTVAFRDINPNDMSTNLTIRIASVNEAPPQNARFPITAVSDSKWQEIISNNNFNHLRVENGVVLGFNQSLSDSQKEQYRNLVIPADIWGEQITSIGAEAFSNSQLTGVTISSGITSIGDDAFINNQLTSVTIPNSVTSIGRDVFDNNNDLITITIGSNVSLGENITSRAADFAAIYNGNGKKAGTYQYCLTCSGGKWFDDDGQMREAVAKANAEMERQRAERAAVEATERAKEARRPKMGISGGIGIVWGGTSLNEIFDLEMDNRNESTFKGDFGDTFSGGLVFILPFTPKIALVGETNYFFGTTSIEARDADNTNSLPKGSSDYIRYHDFNFPVMLQIASANREAYLEIGAQANILSASNRDKQKSSISDYGFVAGLGFRPPMPIEVNIRLGLNGSGYYTAMFAVRTVFGRLMYH